MTSCKCLCLCHMALGTAPPAPLLALTPPVSSTPGATNYALYKCECMWIYAVSEQSSGGLTNLYFKNIVQHAPVLFHILFCACKHNIKGFNVRPHSHGRKSIQLEWG